MSEMREKILSGEIPGDRSNGDLMVNALVAIAEGMRVLASAAPELEELRHIREELHHANTHAVEVHVTTPVRVADSGIVKDVHARLLHQGRDIEGLEADMDKLSLLYPGDKDTAFEGRAVLESLRADVEKLNNKLNNIVSTLQP